MVGWNHDFEPQHSSPYRRAPGGRGLTASLAACGNTAETDDDADDATETDDATDTDDDADDASDSDDDSTDAAGTAGALSVSVQGQGVKALVLGDESTASGEATALNGKLISGPGG